MASEKLKMCEDRVNELIEERDGLQKDKEEMQHKLGALENEKSRIEQLHNDYNKKLEDTKEEMQNTFKNLANESLKSNSGEFSGKMSELLNPFKENIQAFQDQVKGVFGQASEEHVALQNQIAITVHNHKELMSKTDGLSRALRGDNKKLGNWGEFVLEKILEDSGLRPGKEYEVQPSIFDADGERNLRPDVVINLPDNKHIVVDSKVSLKHYDALINSQDEGKKVVMVKEFINSVKNHVKDLAKKDYCALKGLNSIDFVLMFMPIEASYMLAMQQDEELHSSAWGERVIIVCPTTLLATLKTVANIWRVDTQNKKATEIANQAGEIYNKFNGFLENMKKLGGALVRSQDAFNKAANQLYYGKKGTIFSRVEKLKELGANKIKEDLVEVEEIDSNNSICSDIKDDA
ncbi:DNA recombination protein RmuC [Rickettsiales bacterium]|nr:DNA recombination protein RmuC [Rickettsiales bacterium]